MSGVDCILQTTTDQISHPEFTDIDTYSSFAIERLCIAPLQSAADQALFERENAFHGDTTANFPTSMEILCGRLEPLQHARGRRLSYISDTPRNPNSAP